MGRVDLWHLIWIVVLILGIILLAGTFFIALYYRESGQTANFSSIWGLWVGIIGFALTIYTMFETQRATRKAQQAVQAATVEAQRAIEKAASEAKDAADKARTQVGVALDQVKREILGWDREGLLHLLLVLRQSAEAGEWPQFLLCARLSSRFVERLSYAAGFREDEKTALRSQADEMRLLTEHVRAKLAAEETINLGAKHTKLLASLEALLDKVSARRFYLPLEVDDADDSGAR